MAIECPHHEQVGFRVLICHGLLSTQRQQKGG